METDLEQIISDFCDGFSHKIKEAKSNNRGYFKIDISELNNELKEDLIFNFKDSSVRKYIQEQVDNLYGKECNVLFDGLEETNIRDLNSGMIGNLVRISGVVISISPPQSMITEAFYRCPEHWGNTLILEQRGEELDNPPTCYDKQCAEKMLLIPEESKWEDYQIIRIQEKPDNISMGDVPRVVKIRVIGNHLIDSCQPGDDVWITGIMSVESKRKRDKVFRWFISLNNIEVQSMDVEKTELTEEEKSEIDYWSNHEKIEEIIINSAFPSIYGLKEEKYGLILSLFGGSESARSDVTLRGSVNVLLVGDPSTAKTAMINASSKIAPKAIYTQAGSTSGVGLTAAAVKEEDQWVLAAGAVVLANGGICCIDEIEKMSKADQDQILECMEKQTVSVHKASIHTTLTAKTAILAAANPKYGRYDDNSTLADNINLPPPLLARFDLIYILRDIPDEERDMKVAMKVMEAYGDEEPDLDGLPLMKPELLRKYIVQARKIKPVIPPECGKKIMNFYVGIRNAEKEKPDSPIPITARQLQGLFRLSVAYARMHLKETVEMEDVDKAIKLFMDAYGRISKDADGNFDSSILETGSTKDQKILDVMMDAFPPNISLTEDEAYESVKHRIDRASFDKGLKMLPQVCVFLRPDGFHWCRYITE